MEEYLTPAQRAGRTNHERAEARKARRKAERMEREKYRALLMGIVDSETSTATEKLEATRLLMELSTAHY